MMENSEKECEIIMNLLDAIQKVRQGYFNLASLELETVIEQLKSRPSVFKDIAERVNKDLKNRKDY